MFCSGIEIDLRQLTIVTSYLQTKGAETVMRNHLIIKEDFSINRYLNLKTLVYRKAQHVHSEIL